MSRPIKYCWLVEAADSPEALAKLAPVMQYNLKCGHFSVWPCDHEPKCRDLTDEEQVRLQKAFMEKSP